MLTRNHRQESLCRAYIQAVAGFCGYSVSVPHPDYGIDLTVNDIEVVGDRRVESGYKIDIQAKSVVTGAAAGDGIRYDLEVRAYETLRHPSPGTPRVLVVLVLPRDEHEWVDHAEERLVLRRCAYWSSLRGSPRRSNRRSVRLAIPRANRFAPESLRLMMRRIKAGEVP